MRWIRDLLSSLALAALTAVSVWAAVTVVREFPDTTVQEPIDIHQWLTQRDLSQASPAERRRVARQFDAELRDGEDLAAELRTQDDQEGQLLKDNLSLVLEHWFHDKADLYSEQSAKRREKWLDRELEPIDRIFSRGRDARSSPQGLIGSLYALGMINKQVEEWIERADPKRQERMREFWRAVQARVMARQRPATD